MALPRLLFVDDESGIRLTLSAILQQNGFDVTVAASVPEALALIGKNRYEVLLSDLNTESREMDSSSSAQCEDRSLKPQLSS
jgi:CheY-like chemotaxis protein